MAYLRVGLCCLLCLAALAGPARSQPPGAAMPADLAEMELLGNQTTGGVVPIGQSGIQLYIEHTAGDGVGYDDDGFTGLSLFLPFQSADTVYFLDGRGYITNEVEGMASAGAGVRRYLPGIDRVLGGSVWFDVDNGHANTFQQAGASWEFLGANWDLRGNFYYPVGETNRFAGQSVQTTFTPLSDPEFQGNFIVADLLVTTAITDRFETALKGADVELGIPIPGLAEYGFKAYAGAYHFQGDGTPETWGGSARLTGRLFRQLQGTLLVSHDQTFGTNLVVNLTKIFGQPPQNSVFNRMFARVERAQRMVVHDQANTVVNSVTENDFPLTEGGAPITVTHVNSTSAGANNGTFEDPFTTLAAADPSTLDIVFVHGGTGPYTDGFSVAPGQRFLGEGNSNSHFQFTDQLGFIQLGPGALESSPGAATLPRPTLSGAPGNAVTVNANTEVSNFDILNPGAAGIFGTGIAAGSTVNVNRVAITGGTNGVHLDSTAGLFTFDSATSITDPSGSAYLEDTSTAIVTYNGTITQNNAAPAVEITGKTGGTTTFNGLITANTSTANGIDLTSNTGSTINFNGGLDIDTTSGTGFFASGGGTVNVTGTNNNIDTMTGTALELNGITIGASGMRFATVDKNDTLGGAEGIDIDNVTQTGGPGLVVGSATVASSTASGIDIANSSITSTFTTVNIDNTAGHGVNLLNAGTASFLGGSIDDTGADGIHAENTNLTVNGLSIGLATATTGIVGDGIEVINSDAVNRTATITNNLIGTLADPVGGRGIVTTVSGTGSLTATVNNNVVFADGDAFRGSATSSGGLILDINNNVLRSTNGIGINLGNVGAASGFTIGPVNFTGGTINGPGGQLIPPDTMGAVGPNHIVVMINNTYAVFDKNGNLISETTDEQFWIDAGIPAATIQGSTFDPRIIFDPSTGRWFAVAIDEGDPNDGTGNRVYVAVSNTSDPTAGWQAVSFVGDLDGDRFNDFDTFGLDALGVFVATNNFDANGALVDVSIFSIPKADLLGAVPTLVNMTRFENEPTTRGTDLQPVVDFGPADATSAILAAQFGGGTILTRNDITGAGAAGATLGATTNIAVTPYAQGPDGAQPGGAPDLDAFSTTFTGNAVEVNNRIYAVQSILGPGGRLAVRFYEIDEATNTVLQQVLISGLGQNLDLLYPSVAVNANGSVVVGFTGTGPNQFASAMAAIGTTTGGVTTFSAPQMIQAGQGTYDVTFGGPLNRWGDYSATVVDPTNPNRFWTFQEFVTSTDEWGVRVAEITVGTTAAANPITVRSFANNTVNGAASGGIVLNGVTFDSNLAAAGLQAVNAGNTLVQGVTAGDGVRMINPRGTINFNDLDVTNTGGTGLLVSAAPGSNFAISTGAGSTINTTSGAAVNINAPQVNLNFQRIDSTGAAVGIDVQNAFGTFNVLGTGAAGSGGTISSTDTNARFSSSLTGGGLSVSLNDMNLTGAATAGISAASLTALSVDNTLLTSTADGWRGIDILQASLATGIGSGQYSLTNNTFIGSGGSQVGINLNHADASGTGIIAQLIASNNDMTLTGFNPRSFVLTANTLGTIIVNGLNNTADDGVTPLPTGNRGDGVDEFELNGGQVTGALQVNGNLIGF
jgi:hypothetical protein